MGITRCRLSVPTSPSPHHHLTNLILDRALSVPEDLAAASGLSEDQVRINLKYGGGYPANVEGLHHLHCLNLLRKGLKWNYDYYQKLGEGAFKNDDYIAKYHISKSSPFHCYHVPTTSYGDI